MEGRSSPSYGGRRSENEIISDYDLIFEKSIRKKSSSATRSSVPRSKILRERLDFSNTQNRKSPNFDQNCLPKKYLASRYSSNPDYEDQNSDVSSCSLKPYDPLTNYLSPRPKFLRYNPNRRREILLYPENEVRELEFEFDTQQSSVEDESSSICSSKEDSGNVMGDKIEVNEVDHCDDDEEDEEIEEFEEESGWFFKGVIKFLLVVITVLLSTLHISTMNTPAPSFDLDGSLKFQNSSFLAAGNQTDLVEWNMVMEDEMELLSCCQDGFGENVVIHDQLIMPQIGVFNDEFEASTETQDSTQIQSSETEENNSVKTENYPIAVYSPFVLEIKEKISTPEDEVLAIDPLLEEDSIGSGKATNFRSIPVQMIGFCFLVAIVAVLGVAKKLRKVRSRVVSEKAGEMKNVEKEEIDIEDESGFTSQNPNEMMMSYSSGMESKIVERSKEEDSIENNSAGSVSYGSFTTQKKILKKENKQQKEITTPVRRSSRLVNKGLFSP